MDIGFDSFETSDFDIEIEDFVLKKTKKFTRIFEIGFGGSVSYCGIEGDNVYFGACDGFLYAVEAATGKELWRFKTGGLIIGKPTFYEGKVFTGSYDGNLYCIDLKTGKEIWRFKASDIVYSSGITDEGMIYFGSNDNFFYAVDVESGKEIWRFQTSNLKIAEWSKPFSMFELEIKKSTHIEDAISEDRYKGKKTDTVSLSDYHVASEYATTSEYKQKSEYDTSFVMFEEAAFEMLEPHFLNKTPNLVLWTSRGS